MKSFVSVLVAAGLVAGLGMSPALAQVFLEDHFTGEELGIPDTVGSTVWSISSGTVPLVDGRAIFDPTENNPTVLPDPDTGEELQTAQKIEVIHRFIPPLQIPPASSGRMIEVTGEIMDRGAESTPNLDLYPDLTHNDADVGEFRLHSGTAEVYVPALGNPISWVKGAPDFPRELAGTNTYWTGFVVNGGCWKCEFPENFWVDSGVPIPGFGESHLLRTRIRSLPSGHGVEGITDYSTDGGATYSRIGRSIYPYGTLNGSDAENPGLFTSFNYMVRGGMGRLNEDYTFDEGEFSSDFIKVEELALAPPDKGDMDLDGDVDFDDINDFVLGLNDPNAYRSTYWVEASQNGDIDMDGDQDFDDIAGFVGILSGGGDVSGVPEPTTLLLAVLGALTAVGYRWGCPRRRMR